MQHVNACSHKRWDVCFSLNLGSSAIWNLYNDITINTRRRKEQADAKSNRRLRSNLLSAVVTHWMFKLDSKHKQNTYTFIEEAQKHAKTECCLRLPGCGSERALSRQNGPATQQRGSPLRKYFIPGCIGRGLDLDLRVLPAPQPVAPAPAPASGNLGFGPPWD